MSGKSLKTLVIAILLALTISFAPLSPRPMTPVLAEGCSGSSGGCPGGG
jgi:hypothetical protein